MRLRAKLGVGLAALVVVAAAGVVAVVSGIGRGPRVDGELTLPGLTADVRVVRDEYGIPYIFARNTADLIRAQGFVTAQDRIFQMEGFRAIATGRLAEAIGEPGLVSDRQVRLLGIPRNAARHARLLSPAARDFLSWYAEGMTAYITDHAGDLPVELKLAGFTARQWTLDDMVVVLHFVNYSQAANFRTELVFQKLIDKLGPEKAAELFPANVNPDRTRQPIIVGSAGPGAGRLGLADADPLARLAAATPFAPIAVGSNNWAIGRSRSASGAAVLVNDPHLDARMLPGIWHPIGLFTPDIQAVGAALPATPGITVGRNAEVAFGVTNGYGDSQDLFVEQIATGGPDHYVDGDQIRPFEIVDETIRIKDKSAPGGFRAERMRIRRTVRGPIISGPEPGRAGDRLLSLRMASAETPGGDIGIDRLLTARSAEDVDKAAQLMDVLYFNYVFVDKDGRIGHRATGRVPVRASRQGLVPKPVGATDDWRGFIPPDQMPGQMAPARDWVATANNDNRPDDYAFDYSTFFSPSYRFRRIGEVLGSAKGMTTRDQIALMTDTVNLQARRLVPVMVAALAGDPPSAEFAAILAAWDGRDDKSTAAPLIYHALYEQLAWETFVDKLGDELTRAWLEQWYPWQERFDLLTQTPDSPWFDDSRTPARETLPDLIRRAAAAVKAELSARLGPAPASWRWGDVHRIRFLSPLRRTGVGSDFLGVPAAAMDGSGETVMRARTAFMGDDQVEFFASMRLVADMGDDEKIEAVVSGGAVDRQFHPHQKDQVAVWSERRLLPWWFDPAKAESHARHTQTLKPKP
jgi:penicillin G amidase